MNGLVRNKGLSILIINLGQRLIIKWDKSNDLSISIKDSLNLEVACLCWDILKKKKEHIWDALEIYHQRLALKGKEEWEVL